MTGDKDKLIKQENREYSAFLVKEGKRVKQANLDRVRQATQKSLVEGLRLGKMSQREAEYKMKKIWEHNSRQ